MKNFINNDIDDINAIIYIYIYIKGYLVKGVKITLIFSIITHLSKKKLIETKIPFLLFSSNTNNFSSSTSFIE